MEIKASNRDINEDSFSIEHILPESPSSHWRHYFSDDQIENMVYRLGNLTPLEPSFNRTIGNDVYIVKKEKYEQSIFSLTKQISAEEWTPDAIANRQESMSKRAINIWQADFV